MNEPNLQRLSPEGEVLRAEIHGDPYAHMVARLWREAWAAGYEQSLRDLEESHGLDPSIRYRKPFRDRVREAEKALVTKETEAAKVVLMLAATGPLLPSLRPKITPTGSSL